jgi:hypothetical protein
MVGFYSLEQPTDPRPLKPGHLIMNIIDTEHREPSFDGHYEGRP